MSLYLTIAGVGMAALLSLFFASLTYSLREYSRPRFAEFLGKHDCDHWFEPITDNTNDLVFLTAVARQCCNILMFVMVFAAFEQTSHSRFIRYVLTAVTAIVIATFFSVAVPRAAAKYKGAEVVGFFAPFLDRLRRFFQPVSNLMHRTDDVVRRALGAQDAAPQQQLEEEILNAVEEGEKEGVVDEQEREMFESVMEFGDTTVGEIMTPKSDLAALPIDASVEAVKTLIERSGHSRMPIYEGTIDHVAGILHARDLIPFLGRPDAAFNIRDLMRPAIFVPETKPLRNLLSDFRVQKVHIAVVLDEYGALAGVVTIEDILEELVGEISDEHEPATPAMFRRIDDHTVDADGRLSIDQINRLLGLALSDSAGYETLGGFLSTTLAKIPEKGTVLEQDGVRYTVIDAEPQRVKRVKIETLTPTPAR